MADKSPTDAEASETTGAELSPDPVSDLQRERDDYHDRWLRKTAEFENYRKRVDRLRREQADETVVGLLQDLLRKHGVRPIDALGADFDPNIHQAVIQEVSPDHREGEVIGELRRGYM